MEPRVRDIHSREYRSTLSKDFRCQAPANRFDRFVISAFSFSCESMNWKDVYILT